MKEFLSREQVPFTVRNVDTDQDAYAELIARGYRTIPVTIIGGEAVKGFDPAALTAALRRARSSPDR